MSIEFVHALNRQPTVADVNWVQGYASYWLSDTDQVKDLLHQKAKTTRDGERKLWLHRLAGYMTAEREVESGRYVRYSVHPIMGLGRWFDEGTALLPVHSVGA